VFLIGDFRLDGMFNIPVRNIMTRNSLAEQGS
jgi:hypothetical protein